MGNNIKKDKQGRFICAHCRKSMESISLTFYEVTRWEWNDRTRQYEQLPTEGDTSYKCGHCGKKIGWDIGKELKD